jgi:hypothetical protein
MNDELVRICNEAHGKNGVHFYICVEGLRKTKRNFSDDSWCPGRDSEQLPFESKSRALILDHKFILVITLYFGDEE